VFVVVLDGGAGDFTATALWLQAAVNKRTAEAESVRAVERLQKLEIPIPLKVCPFIPGGNPVNAVFRG
jgi:hypothetical protein